MLQISDAQQIVALVTPPAKREGYDMTFSEMFSRVAFLASSLENPIVVPLSSFRRAKFAMGIKADSRGLYSRGDAAILLGWFASQGQYRTYAAYKEAIGLHLHSQYA